MSLNLDLEGEHQDAAVSTITDLETSESQNNLGEKREAALGPLLSKAPVAPQAKSEAATSMLETALTTPRTILVKKASTPATKSLTTTAGASPVTTKDENDMQTAAIPLQERSRGGRSPRRRFAQHRLRRTQGTCTTVCCSCYVRETVWRSDWSGGGDCSGCLCCLSGRG